MNRLVLLLCLLFFTTCIFAQSDFRIGQWQSYLPFSIGKSVTIGNDKVYYGTESGVVMINLTDSTQTFITRENGLDDVDVRLVKYHQNPAALVIVYENSNIDIIFEDRIVNFNNILANNTIIGSKQINHIYNDDSEFIYLSCAFGLVEFNMNTRKFGFTLFTPDEVTGYAVFQGKSYISTEDGIYVYDPASQRLIEDIDSWRLLNENDGLPSNYTSEAIAAFGDRLYAGVNGELYLFDGDWMFFYEKEDFTLNYISPEGSKLMAGFRCDDDCIGRTLFFEPNGANHEAGFSCNDRPVYSLEDPSGKIWYADSFDPFRTAENEFATCTRERFNTVWSNKVVDLAVAEDVLYVASGGANQSFTPLLTKDGFFQLENGNWTIYNEFVNEDLKNTGTVNHFRVLPFPDNSKVFVATYATGLLEYNFDSFTVHNNMNSPIQPAAGDNSTQRIAGLALDRDQNVWMTNYFADENRPIVVLKNDGTFTSFNPFCISTTSLTEIVVDHRGYKWIIDSGNSNGVIVYDENGTIDDPMDDQCREYNAANSELPTNGALSLAVDLNGDVWVGTNEGPVIFDGNADIFGGDHAGFRIKIDQEGIIAFLLSAEEILSIAVDGANRKWFGTRNGVFVQSANGEDQIAYYNTTNSPLLDNQVNTIAIQPENGVVYLGTNAGIISVRTDATTGTEKHVKSDVYAFPNPVRENYDGPIAIRGLARDANVKVTDIQGNLIFETIANGGQAIWDGRNFDGRKASTGVYLVYSTAEGNGFSKPDAIVTKILFVN